jgi:hypothetical protein
MKPLAGRRAVLIFEPSGTMTGSLPVLVSPSLMVMPPGLKPAPGDLDVNLASTRE